MSEFTTDWFTSAIPLFDDILGPFKGRDGLTVLEIGSFEGRSAIWFIENLLTGKDSKIICVDTFEGSLEHEEMGIVNDSLRKKFDENMREYRGKYRVLMGKSQDILRTREFDNKIDIVYIDGSHRAPHVLIDACLTFLMLKRGGVMIFDDYTWNYNRYPVEDTPRVAIDAILTCFKGLVKVRQFTWKTVMIEKL